MPLYSNNPTVDKFLDVGFGEVLGMSSRFSAAICTHLIRRQSDLGIVGPLAEIGVYMGRFFIAMALGAAENEKAVAIDQFTWPDAGVKYQFLANCLKYGLSEDNLAVIKSDSRSLSVSDIQAAAGAPIRFWHVDGDHTRQSLANDLDLALRTLHPKGIICLDDMLHPHYPLLVVGLFEWLEKNPHMQVLAIIDRVTVVYSSKILICAADSVDLYKQDLAESFPDQNWQAGSLWERYDALLLTTNP